MFKSKSFQNLLFIILIFILNSCNKPKENKQIEKIKVTVSKDSLINIMKGGIGVNFHSLHDSLPVVQMSHLIKSYGGSAWGANPALTDSLAWNKLFSMADWLGLDLCRLAFQRKSFEPQKGKFTFNSYEMNLLYKYLDYCESRGIDVFLQNMWNNVEWLSVPTAKGDPIKILRSAPNDLEAYTNGLITLLDELINIRAYSCIKYISISNEPFENWSWYMARFDPDSFASPEPAFKMMQEKLRKSNLNVKLSGPDISVYHNYKFAPNNASFFNYLDAFDIHSYVTRYDWYSDTTITFEDGNKGQLDKLSLTEHQYADWKSSAWISGNKPFIISEMGSFMYGFGGDTSAMSSYDALLKDAESVIRYSNIGLDGFIRWNFVNRGILDGQWQIIDTWDPKNNKPLAKEEFKPHSNTYFMWGILTRFTPKNAAVLKTTLQGGIENKIQRVFSATYANKKRDRYSVYIVNDNEKPYEAEVTLPSASGWPYYAYQIAKPDSSKEVSLNRIKEIKPGVYTTSISIPAKSITVLTQYIMNDSHRGIILN